MRIHPTMIPPSPELWMLLGDPEPSGYKWWAVHKHGAFALRARYMTEHNVFVVPVVTRGTRCGMMPAKPDDIDIQLVSSTRTQMYRNATIYFKWEIEDAKRKKGI